MPKGPEPDISREDLARARDAVRLQITILGSNRAGAGEAKLREVLAALNEELAETIGDTSSAPITDSAASESRRPGARQHLQRADLKAILILTALLVVFLVSTVFAPLAAHLLAPLLPASITQSYYSHFNSEFDQKWICNEVMCRKP
jgi:hypothetical protein